MNKINKIDWKTQFKYDKNKLYRIYHCVAIDDVAFVYNCCFIQYFKLKQN